METGISWKWLDVFMRLLTGFAVALCAVGFVAPAYSSETHSLNSMALAVGLGLSGATAVCLLLSNSMAATAAIQFTHGKTFSCAISVGVFIGGAMVSMTSMHTGWSVFRQIVGEYASFLPNDHQMGWAFGYVAFVKPAVNWGIQSLKQIDREIRTTETDKDRAEAERRAQRLMEMEERKQRQHDVEGRRKNLHVVPKAAAAAAATFGIPALAAAETPVFPMENASHSAPASADTQAHSARGWKGPRNKEQWELFKECVRRGMTQQEIIEDTKIPTTTVYRWWIMMNVSSHPQAANA